MSSATLEIVHGVANALPGPIHPESKEFGLRVGLLQADVPDGQCLL